MIGSVPFCFFDASLNPPKVMPLPVTDVALLGRNSGRVPAVPSSLLVLFVGPPFSASASSSTVATGAVFSTSSSAFLFLGFELVKNSWLISRTSRVMRLWFSRASFRSWKHWILLCLSRLNRSVGDRADSGSSSMYSSSSLQSAIRCSAYSL
jgi:hypothetical protein